MASAVTEAFHGRKASVGKEISLAWECKKVIIGWAFVAATVGLLLRLITEKVPGGFLIEAIGGLAWSVASWFGIPSLAVEGKVPWESLKASARTIKSPLGEGITGVVAIGGIFMVLSFLVLVISAVIVFSLISSNTPLTAIIVVSLFAFCLLLGLLLIASTLRQIFNVAVFLSVKENSYVGPFTSDDINKAIIYKKKTSSNI